MVNVEYYYRVLLPVMGEEVEIRKIGTCQKHSKHQRAGGMMQFDEMIA